MAPQFGCLILHGFTSSLDCVQALVPMVEQLEMPYRMPVLRGHGTRPEDLRGVSWKDWYADAERSFHDLRNEVDGVFICGLSMGGLVALHLAAAHGQATVGVVSIAAALRFVDPMTRLSPALARILPMFDIDARRAYSDPSLAAANTNYTRFATDSFVSLYRYGRVVEQILPRVQAPLLVIHGRRDRVIKPSAAQVIYERAGSARKELRWFERSGHEMLRDCEAREVVAASETFIRQVVVPLREAEW